MIRSTSFIAVLFLLGSLLPQLPARAETDIFIATLELLESIERPLEDPELDTPVRSLLDREPKALMMPVPAQSALLVRTRNLLEAGHVKDGLQELNRVYPRLSDAWVQRRAELLYGIIAVKEKRYEESVPHFRRAAEHPDLGYTALVNLAAAYLTGGELEKAEKVYEELEEIPPGSSEISQIAVGNLAILKGLLGQPEEAVKILRKASTAGPARVHLMMSDPQFDVIRDHPSFTTLDEHLREAAARSPVSASPGHRLR